MDARFRRFSREWLAAGPMPLALAILATRPGRVPRRPLALLLVVATLVGSGCRSNGWWLGWDETGRRAELASELDDERQHDAPAKSRERTDDHESRSARGKAAGQTDSEADTPHAGRAEPAGSAAANEPHGEPPAALGELDWVRTVALPGQPAPRYRWRHMGLDPIMLRAPRTRPDLSQQLADRNPIVSGNAAIVLTRWAAQDSAEDANSAPSAAIDLPMHETDAALRAALDRSVRLGESDIMAAEAGGRRVLRAGAKERSLQVMAFRSAAAEALGWLASRESVPATRQLLDELGRFDGEARAAYQAELHAELLAALARHVSASDDPRFRAALASPAQCVQIEALRIWSRDSDHALPHEALALRMSDAPAVRAEALHAMAACRHPAAHEHLERALNDADASVRLAAVAALGELGTEQACATLRAVRANRSEFLRAAAVGALASLGGDPALAEAAVDKSWQVRQAVADSLAKLPRDADNLQHEARRLANHLVHDASSQVQQHAVAALASWPIEQAGPVLLVGMASGNFQIRRQAAAALAERWPAAAAFPADGSESQRAESLAKLRHQFAADYGPLDEIVENLAEVEELVQLSAARLQELRELLATLRDPRASDALRARASAALAQFGPALLVALESLAVEELGPLPVELYRDVLPKISPYFVAIAKLRSDNVAERRAGAAELARLAAEASGKPMPNLALNSLLQLLASEADPLVWQAVLAAVSHDPRAAAAQLAYLAIASASVEVRRRAAEHLAEHGNPRHVAVLLPLLEDPSPVVVLAAIRALGRQGTLPDPTPLLVLLNSGDLNLRLEAATSLARLKVSAGFLALETLAQETSAEVRRRVATSMGEAADPLFTAALMAMLDDRSDVQAEALRSLPRCAGEDACRDAEGPARLLPDEQVRRWKQWYHDRASSPGAPRRRTAS